MLSTGVLPPRAEQASGIEPHAGTWKTWIIGSGPQFRLPPPPDRAETEKELGELVRMATTRDRAALDRVAYWDTGAPSYRWSEIAVGEHLNKGIGWQIASRNLALMHIAIYDAMVAAWDSEYAYNRPRPSAVEAGLTTVVANPPSPSYPAEHAVAAGAASEVLAYIFPDRAAFFQERAEEAARSRLTAGVNYPSDVVAGMALGRQVAALVIARGKSDGTDAKWNGSVPAGPGKWTGTNPILPMAGTWKPWVLSSPDEFRPAPPALSCCHLSRSMMQPSPVGKRNTPTGRSAPSSSTRKSRQSSPRQTIQATRRLMPVPQSPSPGRSAIFFRAMLKRWQRSVSGPRSRASGLAFTTAAISSPVASSLSR